MNLICQNIHFNVIVTFYTVLDCSKFTRSRQRWPTITLLVTTRFPSNFPGSCTVCCFRLCSCHELKGYSSKIWKYISLISLFDAYVLHRGILTIYFLILFGRKIHGNGFCLIPLFCYQFQINLLCKAPIETFHLISLTVALRDEEFYSSSSHLWAPSLKLHTKLCHSVHRWDSIFTYVHQILRE